MNTTKLALLAETFPWILRLHRGRWLLSQRSTLVAADLIGKPQPVARLIPASRALAQPLRQILSRVQDEQQMPLELHQADLFALSEEKLDLPLDDEAGFKMALIMILCRTISQSDRLELIARRVERMTREEAGYLLSRCRDYGADCSRWAITGLRVTLGGKPNDPGVARVLATIKR